MPTDPHSWNDDQDYLTAWLLNNDLACYSGKEFYPTGINFHARRPLYKSAANVSVGNLVTSGSWGQMYQNTGPSNQAIITCDTGNVFASWMDPYVTGNVNLRINAGGGQHGVQGGLLLLSGFSLWPAMSFGYYGAGLGNANGSTEFSDGTFQGSNDTFQGCAMVMDITNANNANRIALLGFNNSGGSVGPASTVNIDGSGAASRLHARWASVYPGNGFKVSAVPDPFTNWTSATELNATFLNGSTGLRDVLRYLNMPPLLKVVTTNTQSLNANTFNTVSLGNPTYDTYGGWLPTESAYVVPLTGLYLVHGQVTTSNFSGELRAGISVNNHTYWGPRALMPGSGPGSAAKTQIFALQGGDQVNLIAWPSASATLSGTYQSKLILTQVGTIGPPAIAVSLPDTSYRWAAGTAGPLHGLFNAHIANDLTFLINRPYLLSYQTTVQTGIAQNAATTVIMDTAGGIVHGETGTNADNYSGFNTSTGVYTAQKAGWYLAVWEVFLNNPSLTVNPSVAAAIQPVPNGLVSWDTYQRQNMAISGQYPGAAGVSAYYLRAGDTIMPGVITGNSSAGTISTAVNTNIINSHFELVWLGE
jgi:hypothetical protein